MVAASATAQICHVSFGRAASWQNLGMRSTALDDYLHVLTCRWSLLYY
jgi:hypothetical protein